MSDLDRLIDEALEDEAEALLTHLEREPGFFERAFGMFRGPAGWIHVAIMVAQAVLFLAGVWMAWKFYQQSDLLDALRWGLPALTLVIIASVLKNGLVPVMEANRIARDIRRLELRIERLREERREAV